MSVPEKCKSRRGESLGEVLVALLIGALAIMMFAGLVSASTGIIGKNRSALQEYYSRNNLLVQYSTGTGVTSSAGSVTLVGALTKKTGSTTEDENVSVTYYVNTTGGREVVNYQRNG